MYLHIFSGVLASFLACTVTTKASSPENTALLIVDVQNCFTEGGSLAVTNGNDVIPVINDIRARFGSRFGLTVLSQDWHCVDHVSFASQHPGYGVLDSIDLYYNNQGELCRTEDVTNSYTVPCESSDMKLLKQILWPDHCIKDTLTAQIHQDLKTETNDVLVHKGNKCHLDSYSVFYDNGRFGQTDLEKILRDHDVTSLYIAGLATDYCIYWTAKDSKELGFETYVITDAIRALNQTVAEAALKDMTAKGIHLIRSTDLAHEEPSLEKITNHALIKKATLALILLVTSFYYV